MATVALMMMALLVVQFALFWHARHIAQYVARRALATARVENGTAQDGRTQARRSLAALAGHILTDASVTAERTSTRTTVRVEGAVMRVLPVPGLVLHVAGTASGPTEKISMPDRAQP
jgi:hypothetical protein